MNEELQQMLRVIAVFHQDNGAKLLFKELKNRVIRDWADSRQQDKREDAWFMLQAIGRLENLIQEIPQTVTVEKVKVATRKPK